MSTRKFIVCDVKQNPNYEIEVDELTLMFLDTLMAEFNAGTVRGSDDLEYADYFECKYF